MEESGIPSAYEQKLIVTCSDGVELVGELLLPLLSEYRAFVQINIATGIRKEFYLPFAQFLASKGFVTYVYDYRGMGESKPGTLRNFPARMRDWGQLDMAAVLDFGNKSFAGLPKFIVGHSIGGQLLGLMPNYYLTKGAFTIASSSGYLRLQPLSFRIRSLFFFDLIIPLTTAMFGYVKAKIFGLMEDLPKNVGLEWRLWCHSPDYVFDYLDDKDNYYKEIQYPIHSLTFTDDPIANAKSVPALMRYFTKTIVKLEWITPSQMGVSKLDHFGFFSRKFKDTLWIKVVEYFDGLLEK